MITPTNILEQIDPTLKQNAEFLLGRDVLNHFIVTLNGLASVTEIS